MKPREKTSPGGNRQDDFYLTLILILAGAALLSQADAPIRPFWELYKWKLIVIGVLLLIALGSLIVLWIRNGAVRRLEEKSILGRTPAGTYLGTDEASGSDLWLREEFRRKHAQVIGTTSAGKTESVILPWAIRDIELGNGLLIVDGKSDSLFLNKLYAYICKNGREGDFRLFSLAHVDESHPFNPLAGAEPEEIAERVFTSFSFDNEYYRNVQYKLFHLILRLIRSRGETPTFSLIQRLLMDVDALRGWLSGCQDLETRRPLEAFAAERERDRVEKVSGLDSYLSHFTLGRVSPLFGSMGDGISFVEAMQRNQILYFQLPSMYYPTLSSVMGKLVLQCFQSAVSKRHLATGKGERKLFSCILDDFQDYIYEGFGAILNKSSSAGVGVVFSHQALGDLDKVSPAFRDVVTTNTNIKCVLRVNDPETAEYFAKSFGTKTTEKSTERKKRKLLGDERTGDASVREVEEYLYHPNIIKRLGTGQGIISVPHLKGVKVARVNFFMREDLPASSLPVVEKRSYPVEKIVQKHIEASQERITDEKSDQEIEQAIEQIALQADEPLKEERSHGK